MAAQETISWFAGVDWGSQRHQVCLLDARGATVGERAFPHSGEGLAELGDWLLSMARAASTVAVAIEVPHGPVVDKTTIICSHVFVRLYYGQVLGVAGSAGRLALPVKSPAGVPLPLDTAAVAARSDLPESVVLGQRYSQLLAEADSSRPMTKPVPTALRRNSAGWRRANSTSG